MSEWRNTMKTINGKVLVMAAALMAASGCITQHGDDMEGEGSEEMEPEPAPTETSTLRVENRSSYTIYDLYMWRCSEQPNTFDQLGTKTIAPEVTFTLTNVPAGCWYIRARNSTSIYWQTPQGVTMSSGKQFTWQLFN
jgi:hypothetical protein